MIKVHLLDERVKNDGTTEFWEIDRRSYKNKETFINSFWWGQERKEMGIKAFAVCENDHTCVGCHVIGN